MKKVLIIAYHFPPIAGGGVFRPLKFVKYLPEYEWLPTVLTVDTRLVWASDNQLLKEIPPSVQIIRARQFEWFYLHIVSSGLAIPKIYDFINEHFLVPDSKIGWYKKAIKMARIRLSAEKYDRIFSTSPTVVSHMIARKLSKEFHIPWVCDFRDFWTSHKNYPFHGKKRGIKEMQLEKEFLENASKITVVTKGMKHRFLEKNPSLEAKKIQVLTNGFDSTILPEEKKAGHFQIIYTGSFYGEYNPEIFITAFQQALEQNKKFAEKASLRLIGKIEPAIQNAIIKKIPNHVSFLPYQSPNELHEHIEQSALLLLFLPENDHYSAYLPKKMFDYMACSKPILAIVPPGECRDLLEKSGDAFFPSKYSAEAISRELITLFQKWLSDTLTTKPDWEFIQQFHYRDLTKKLVEIFES
ncbi:MAG: glycosyltransferase [Candidatus Marinimicrobia bacterium]|nr:glycosyltransferase [Candidatus Neomarinimicrobiota bacterium]